MADVEDKMKSSKLTIFFALIVLCFLTLVIFAFSSVTANNCVARVKGGSGTVEDPLRIEHEIDHSGHLLRFNVFERSFDLTGHF